MELKPSRGGRGPSVSGCLPPPLSDEPSPEPASKAGIPCTSPAWTQAQDEAAQRAVLL